MGGFGSWTRGDEHRMMVGEDGRNQVVQGAPGLGWLLSSALDPHVLVVSKAVPCCWHCAQGPLKFRKYLWVEG